MTNSEALKRIRRFYEEALEEFVGDTEDYMALDMAIEALEQSLWIQCSERLPEEDGLYFVTTSKGQVQVHAFSHNGNSKEYWMRCNKAWMPLPEPYKGGEQDE